MTCRQTSAVRRPRTWKHTGVHQPLSQSKSPRNNSDPTHTSIETICVTSSFCEEVSKSQTHLPEVQNSPTLISNACQDYNISRYVGEFINTLSNAAYSIFPCNSPLQTLYFRLIMGFDSHTGHLRPQPARMAALVPRALSRSRHGRRRLGSLPRDAEWCRGNRSGSSYS